MLILGLQDLLQSLNLGITPIDNVEPHCPHDNIGGDHSWNEYVPVCWMTTQCQVDQFVPSTSILIQYGSKLLTIHLYFQVLPFWFGDHPNKDEKRCIVALSFCLPVRNTVPRIFEHVLPCRKTTLKFFARGLSHPGNFLGCSSRNTRLKHLVVLSNDFLVWFAFPLGASWVNVIKKWCWLLNVNVFHQFLPHKS